MADTPRPNNEPAVNDLVINEPSARPEDRQAIAEQDLGNEAPGGPTALQNVTRPAEAIPVNGPPVDETSVPGFEFPGDRENKPETVKSPKQGGRLLRSLQWLSLLITLPFLALNGLAAWQVRSLTNYSQSADPDGPPLFAQPPLKRLGAFAFGAKIPRPQNNYSPADIGLEFESHRIDLGNGEFLDGWHVPPALAGPPDEPEPSTPAPPADETASAPADLADEAAPPADATTQPEAEPTSTTEEPAAIATAATAEPTPDSAPTTSVPAPETEKRGMVLLFPAYAASKQTLLQEVRLLHRLGYASFAVDPRGVGDSSGSDTTLGRREAADVAATVNYVAETFENPPVALYGRLLSAGYVMRAIADSNLQPQALILEDPPAQLFSMTQAAVESVGLPRSPTTQMLTFWGGLLQSDEPSAYDPIIYAEQITTPTLVLYGSEDSWVSLDEVVGIHSQLQGQKEILGLSSTKIAPVSATAYGPWLERVEAFLDSNLSEQK